MAVPGAAICRCLTQLCPWSQMLPSCPPTPRLGSGLCCVLCVVRCSREVSNCTSRPFISFWDRAHMCPTLFLTCSFSLRARSTSLALLQEGLTPQSAQTQEIPQCVPVCQARAGSHTANGHQRPRMSRDEANVPRDVGTFKEGANQEPVALAAALLEALSMACDARMPAGACGARRPARVCGDLKGEEGATATQ